MSAAVRKLNSGQRLIRPKNHAREADGLLNRRRERRHQGMPEAELRFGTYSPRLSNAYSF